MSTKGKSLSLQTKNKIALNKRKYTEKALTNKTLEYLDQVKTTDKLPTLSGLALYLNITSATLNNYRTMYEEFALLTDYVLTFQEEELIQRSLTDSQVANFSKFLLKSKHKYQENAQSLTQNNYLNIAPEVLKEALQLMHNKE